LGLFRAMPCVVKLCWEVASGSTEMSI
jgi:hypothetical protein